jgi:beta-ureidopropionase
MIRFLPLIVAAVCTRSARPDEPPPVRNHLVRVVTVSTDRLAANSRGGILEGAMERLNDAASFQPDIACLPELFTRSAAEAVPGPTTKLLGAWAQKHSCYVIAGIKTLSAGRTYNSAVLLDRRGQLIGQFNKIHPTERELEEGITPGLPDPPVFDTDFGRIGIQICFDVNWWENWKRLKEKGARIVFFPAAYPAAQQLSAIALANEFFVVRRLGRGPPGFMTSRAACCRPRVITSSGRGLYCRSAGGFTKWISTCEKFAPSSRNTAQKWTYAGITMTIGSR